MSYKLIQKLTTVNRTVGRSGQKVEFIVVHYFGTLAPALNVANYWQREYAGASAHLVMSEDEEVFQVVKFEDTAWHCGTTGAYKNNCRNSNSIGIELRPYKHSTATMYASDTDWYFKPEAVTRLVEVVKDLMKQFNLSTDRVIRHYDVTGKICPNPFCVDAKANVAWADFKKRLVEPTKEEEPEMTEFEVKKIVNEAIKTAYPVYETLEDVPSWARPAVEKAIAAGELRGNERGQLNLSPDFLRMIVYLDQKGV